MSPKGQESRGNIAAAFGSFAENYEKRTGGAHNEVARKLMSMSAPFDGTSRVLDNATGTGVVVEELQRHLSSMLSDDTKVAVVAADAAKPMIEYLDMKIQHAKETNAWPNLGNIDTHTVRAENLDASIVPDNVITHAYMNFGIFFCSDPVAAASNIHRCLKPGATALITTWYNLDFMNPVRETQHALYPDEAEFKMPFSKSWENQDYVIDIFVQAGFAKENIYVAQADTYQRFKDAHEMANAATDLFTALVKGSQDWEAGARDKFAAKMVEVLPGSDGFEDNGSRGVSLRMLVNIFSCTK